VTFTFVGGPWDGLDGLRIDDPTAEKLSILHFINLPSDSLIARCDSKIVKGRAYTAHYRKSETRFTEHGLDAVFVPLDWR